MKNPHIPLVAACFLALTAAAQSTGPTEPAPEPTAPEGAAHGAIVDKTPEGMDRAKPDAHPRMPRETGRADNRRSRHPGAVDVPATRDARGHREKRAVDDERRKDGKPE